MKSPLFCSTSKVFGPFLKEHHETWLTTRYWEQTQGRKKLKAIISAGSGGKREALYLRGNSLKVQLNVCRITSEKRNVDSGVKNDNARLLIHNDHFKR